jgi:hypothetical protein
MDAFKMRADEAVKLLAESPITGADVAVEGFRQIVNAHVTDRIAETLEQPTTLTERHHDAGTGGRFHSHHY